MAFPTETVYGLGADARSPEAVARVFALKGRPSNNPLIVHVADEAMARSLAGAWPSEAQRLAQAFWPGPLTIVVPRAEGETQIPDIVTAGGASVALRCPDHPIALGLLRAFGGPLVGPSANRSGCISPTLAEHVRREFPGDEPLILDGGPCRRGIESTVVRVPIDRASRVEQGVTILRPGVVTQRDLERVLGLPVETAATLARADAGALPSPGMLERHYAPRSAAFCFAGTQWPDVLDALLDLDAPAALLVHERRSVPHPHRRFAMPADAAAYASALYRTLREADESAPTSIFIERPGDDARAWPGDPDAWAGVHDRLRRATEPFGSS